MDTIVTTLSEHMKKHMPRTHMKLQNYSPIVLRTKLALKIMPVAALQSVNEAQLEGLVKAKLDILEAVWHELQLARTQIRQRDNAPMIGYTTYSIDTTQYPTSQQDAVLDTLIEKVERVAKIISGSFSDGAKS